MASRRTRRHLNTSRRKALAGLTVAALVIGGYLGTTMLDGGDAAVESPVTVAAAGDINSGSSGSTSARATGALISALNPDKVLTLGDAAYPDGTDANFASFNLAWPFKAKTLPAIGNHEMHVDGDGYYRYYFGGVRTGNEYRAYDLGNGWRAYSLNCEIACGSGSPQDRWLRADLAAHPDAHKIGYLHRARYTSGDNHGSQTVADNVWRAMDAGGADVMLAGHDHIYEHGKTGPVNWWVVGTGGAGRYGCGSRVTGSLVCNDDHYGVLVLRLFSGRYEFEWRTTDAGTLDAGSASTRTGGGTSTTSGSSSTSSSSSSTTSSTSSTTTTTLPGSCTQHSGTEFVTARYLHVVYSGCWEGGAAWATNDWSAPWTAFHRSAMFIVRGPVTIRKTAAVNFGDGYHVEQGNGFLFDRVVGVYLHDDAIENDRHQSGTVRDSMFTTYVGYSDSGEDSTDGSARTVTLDGNYFELLPVPGPYKGPSPGTGPWFKLDSKAARLRLVDNTFVARQVPNHGDLNPPSRLGTCTGNTVRWLGAGPFPARSAWLAACPDTRFEG